MIRSRAAFHLIAPIAAAFDFDRAARAITGITVASVGSLVAVGCSGEYPYTPCILIASGCEDTDDGASDGTGETDGGAGTDGGADETGSPTPTAEPFEPRMFISQHQEYDGVSGSGTPYGVPLTCLTTDAANDALSLGLLLKVAGWDVRTAVDMYRDPEAGTHANLNNWAESYDGSPFNDFFPTASDDADADAYDVAIFGGHGGQGAIHSNVATSPDPYADCIGFHQDHIRLGMYCGITTKIAAYSASCVATIDEGICPPPTPDPMNPGFWAPWPDLCFAPLRCTIGRSAVGLTLAFVDSPSVSTDQQEAWWKLATQIGRVGPAWILAHAVDEPSGMANQPAVYVQAPISEGANATEIAAALSARYLFGDVNTGNGLDQMLPDSPFADGFAWLTWDGHTGLTDSEGNEITYGEQDSAQGCNPDHVDICEYEQIDPPGASPYDCPTGP